MRRAACYTRVQFI